MARYLGIDIGSLAVRAVVVRTAYRRQALEALATVDLSTTPDPAEALRQAAGVFATRCDGVAIAIGGEQIFWRRFDVPSTAMRQIANVVPFEIEAQLPVDIDQVVFDYRTLGRGEGDAMPILAAVAREDEVRARIALVQSALGVEPEIVAPGPLALASLLPAMPELAAASPAALVDLGASRTDVVVLDAGQPVFARTLSTGAQGLPATAGLLARELRQTLGAWRSLGGAPIAEIFLAGGGASLEGAETFLTGELGVPTRALPAPRLEGVPPEQAAGFGRYAKAVGLALSLAQRPRPLNLRQGPLAYERGYGFLRERVPLLAGLGSVILVSFLFATWAEMRSLDREHETLEGALAHVSKDVLGEETREAARAVELLEKGPGGVDEDPLPRADAFDVLARLADAVPADVKHDVDEIDVQRGAAQGVMRVNIHGVVPKVQDAENLAAKLKEHRCFNDVKLVKTSQQIGGEGQKYHMEFELRCVDEAAKKPAAPAAGSAAPAASAGRGPK
jgi:general secretion pathway protein L